jgi:peptide/nickel transport system substrate-binding protein
MQKRVFGLAMAAALALPAGAPRAADLTVAVGGAFTSMDPHFFDLSPNHALTWHVFDRLVHPDPDQRPSPAWPPVGSRSTTAPGSSSCGRA